MNVPEDPIERMAWHVRELEGLVNRIEPGIHRDNAQWCLDRARNDLKKMQEE